MIVKWFSTRNRINECLKAIDNENRRVLANTRLGKERRRSAEFVLPVCIHVIRRFSLCIGTKSTELLNSFVDPVKLLQDIHHVLVQHALELLTHGRFMELYRILAELRCERINRLGDIRLRKDMLVIVLHFELVCCFFESELHGIGDGSMQLSLHGYTGMRVSTTSGYIAFTYLPLDASEFLWRCLWPGRSIAGGGGWRRWTWYIGRFLCSSTVWMWNCGIDSLVNEP